MSVLQQGGGGSAYSHASLADPFTQRVRGKGSGDQPILVVFHWDAINDSTRSGKQCSSMLCYFTFTFSVGQTTLHK